LFAVYRCQFRFLPRFLGLLMRFWGSIAFVFVFRGVPFNGQKTIRRQSAVLGS